MHTAHVIVQVLEIEGQEEAEEETEEERQSKGEKIADLMSLLTPEQISEAMDSVFAEMLTDFKVREATLVKVNTEEPLTYLCIFFRTMLPQNCVKRRMTLSEESTRSTESQIQRKSEHVLTVSLISVCSLLTTSFCPMLHEKHSLSQGVKYLCYNFTHITFTK